mmetsp:Transcript_24333/g.23949  ORF Transcript_24333/g.23949 Transcript_24333/m.23949 type:complete len:145 (+) Transcript_24333:455-889(+)
MIGARIIFIFLQNINFFKEMVSLLYLEDCVDAEHEARMNPRQEPIGTVREGELSSNRLKLGMDLEGASGKMTSLMNKLTEKYFRRRSPGTTYWSYLTMQCCKGSKRARIFRKSQNLFQMELSMEVFVKKMRMLDLYLELKLKPF